MTGPSRTPRGEHPGRPGITWETRLESTGEQLADDDTAEPPRPNRATRRATTRAARRRRTA